ncbi:tetratricopeptide repeat protein [Patescibacteria group bacterium]|nr:tetratricopeptide repeat protein [Patescibacteria group bacterium]
MNPNKPEVHDCPYNNPAEKVRLRNLVDSMNVLIRHHSSLSGAESKEDFVKELQKLLLKSGLPNEVRSRLQPFYLSAQLKAAHHDEWFDAEAMNETFQGAMDACLEQGSLERLQDLAVRTRALISQRFDTNTPLSPEKQLKKDLLAISNVNPVHSRVRNFFRKKIREGIPKKSFDFNAVLEELKKDWKVRQSTAEIKEAERREKADKTLNSIRADIQMEQHIREVLRTPAKPKEEVNVAKVAEQALADQLERLPQTKPQIQFSGDMVEVDSKASETPAVPPEADTAFPPLTGMPMEEFSPLMEDPEAEKPAAEPEQPEVPAAKKDLLSRQFTKIIGPEKNQWNGLMMATFSGNENSVRRFLKQGIDVNEVDETGYTPLMLAAENGFTHIVKILIDHKADWKLKDKKGETALDKACRVGHNEVAAILAFKWGNKASHDRDYELARQYFEQVINLDPNFLLARENLSYVLERLEELKLAAEKKARLLIKSARQAVQMGGNFNNQNDFERALECYKKVFTQGFNPTPDIVAMAHFGMGQVYLKKNELEPAKEHFEEILKTDPNHFDACYYLGYIFHRQENLEAAKIWYNKALQIRPDDGRVKNYLSAIRNQETPRTSSGSTLEDAFAALAVQQQDKETEFQATMGQSEIDVPGDMLSCESGDDAEPYNAPDINQLNGIGLPVEPDNLPPPPLPPDAIPAGEDASGFTSPAVRGQSSQLSEEELERKRVRARKRLEELCRVIACEEHRLGEELDEAVKGYVTLVKQPTLSCIEGVDHRMIAIKLRDLWRQGLMKDFTPVEMAHAQDLAVSDKISGRESEEYFIALVEYGKSCFETKTLVGFKKAKSLFSKALKIIKEPEEKYMWVIDLLNETREWIGKLKEEEKPVRIEKDFENSLRPPTIVAPDMPEAVRKEAQGGMGIFNSKTRKFVPGKTKVRREEPKTIPRGEVLEKRLAERMGNLADEPVTQKNIKIPEKVCRSGQDEFEAMPPTIPNAASKKEIADNPEFRRNAQKLRHQYIESKDPAHKSMLQKTIIKYHHDDITFHQKKSAESYLEFGISLITFGDKPRAAQALNEALALVREDQQTLKGQINEWLGKLDEKAV